MPDIAGTRSPLMFIPPQLDASSRGSAPDFFVSSTEVASNPKFSLNPPTHADYMRLMFKHNVHRYQDQLTSLDIHLDKLRIVDALTARDVAVYRLQSACASVRVKQASIQQLERERDEMKMSLDLLDTRGRDVTSTDVFAEQRTKLMDQIAILEATNTSLKCDVETLKAKQESISALNTPRFNELAEQSLKGFPFVEEDSELLADVRITAPSSVSSSLQDMSALTDNIIPPEDKRKARYSILAHLPIPSLMPTDTLIPIVIPPPFSIHDFLGTFQGELKTQLANYRVFQESMTNWCPDREEHGYFIAPAFKCITNPRVSTAHRWVSVDIVAKCDGPMECFYNKENKWYYAGLYKPFHLAPFSSAEYNALSSTTSQALIKETLSGRKNTSPQNVYETAQLYACGALRVACVGLQCVGFSEDLYRALLDQAEACAKVGRWRRAVVVPPAVAGSHGGGGSGLSAVGTAWNIAANLVGSGQGTVPGIVKISGAGRGGLENAQDDDLVHM